MKIVIIQPTTIERNLGGICYMPYWLYSALREHKRPVDLYENTTMRELDEIIEKHGNANYVIDMTSYPQVDAALAFYRDIRTYGYKVSFIGYQPLMKAHNVPEFDMVANNINILDGVFSYLYYSQEYKYGLLSDCDNHLKAINDNRRVVPLFLSIGCKRQCPYCYVSATNYPYGQLDWDKTKALLQLCLDNNWNIHFTDENFLANRNLSKIIDFLSGKNLKWICLTDTITLSKTIESYGEEALIRAGNVLNEVGLESYSTDTLNKNQKVKKLLYSTLNIFWLTVTFLPHETITGLNETGEFLRKHGYKKDELLPRVRTNSTVGGLGQFCQLYHGTEYHKNLDTLGKVYTDRAVRLYPSFIGHKLLNGVPVLDRELTEEDIEWFDLYVGHEKIAEVIKLIDGVSTFEQIMNNDLDRAIALAQLARLNVIKERK